jgi:DNA-binding NtrC family response regulator
VHSAETPTELDDVTESTDEEPGSSTKGAPAGLVIRWVFPLPPLPPVWLDSSSRLVFGRDANCDVRLPSGQVSRRHVEIVRSGPLWLATDLDSKNGLRVRGARVRSAALAEGDVIRIGDFVGVVVRAQRGADLGFGALGGGLYGGAAQKDALRRLREVAPTGLPVVLVGATGTGKDRFARALHDDSGRRGPFLAVNCAVYSKSVAAAELFGYRKGAFTGADAASVGHVRAAEGGTLLLDELVELSLDVQAMLLRVVENGEVLPLGESRPVPIDVRFVAASQIPLSRAVEEGRFRPDLRARLEGGVVRLPPLTACRETVPEFFCTLFEQHEGGRPELSAAFAERLCLHDWDLNVRELDMLARRLARVCPPGRRLDGDLLDDWPRPSQGGDSVRVGADQECDSVRICEEPAHPPAPPVPIPGRRSRNAPYDAQQVDALLSALARSEGNVTRAASYLGLTRQKAYRIIRAAKRAQRPR